MGHKPYKPCSCSQVWHGCAPFSLQQQDGYSTQLPFWDSIHAWQCCSGGVVIAGGCSVAGCGFIGTFEGPPAAAWCPVQLEGELERVDHRHATHWQLTACSSRPVSHTIGCLVQYCPLSMMLSLSHLLPLYLLVEVGSAVLCLLFVCNLLAVAVAS